MTLFISVSPSRPVTVTIPTSDKTPTSPSQENVFGKTTCVQVPTGRGEVAGVEGELYGLRSHSQRGQQVDGWQSLRLPPGELVCSADIRFTTPL